MLSHSSCSVLFENASLDTTQGNMAPAKCDCDITNVEAEVEADGCVFESCDSMKWEVFDDSCLRQDLCFNELKRSRRAKSVYIPRPLSPLNSNSLSTTATKRRISLGSRTRVYAYFHKIISKTQSSPSQVVLRSTPDKDQSRSRKFSSNSLFLSPIRNNSKKKRHKSHYLYCPMKRDKDTVEIHEERHDDVIYTITAKKNDVTNKQTPNSYDVTTANNLTPTSKHIKGATVGHMVKRLAKVYTTEAEDINFLNVFFTTYRTFTDAETVLTILSQEYSELENERSKNEHLLRSIVRVLKAWLEKYWEEDFYHPPRHTLLRNVMQLANRHDGIEDENCNVASYKINSQSNFTRRKNGIINSSFSGYVSAKLAVAEKRSRNNYDTIVLGHLPHDNCKTEHSEEELSSNAEASKQFLEHFLSGTVAEQLTSIDAKLFVNVLPHHCLAAVMCKERPATVQATKNQFNQVVFCVRATILCPGSKISTISKLIMKWIDVAQECREMKNFSSLFAIISCLKTHAIHRLKRAWLGVSQEHTNLLNELSDLNMKDLIMKVGTAKFNTEESSISKVRKDATLRRNQDINSGIVHGTVPYLGSFLTDLVHLDTALSDHIEGGLINFEKRRRAFEVLAQLQLWQASCRNYQNIKMDDNFCQWFNSITPVSENQSFKLSEIVEPCSVPLVSQSVRITKENGTGRLLTRSSDASLMLNVKKNKDAELAAGKLSHSFSSYSSSPLRTIKVTLVMKEQYNEYSSTNYKTIQINSNERANAVIKKIMRQYLMPDDSDWCKNFSLIQIMEQAKKELPIPDTENVYYAMNSTDLDPKFVLLENGADIPSHKKSSTSTLPRKSHKKIHRKNHSVSLITTSAGDLSVDSISGIPSRPKSTHASPMKSLYKQLAFSSVGMSSGSYSPSQARKRIESDKIKNLDDKRKKKASDKYKSPLLTSVKMNARRFSADDDSVIVLPVQSMAVQSAKQRGQEEYILTRNYSDSSTRSAPCSPPSSRKTAAVLLKEDEIYSGTSYEDVDYKWSRRQAFRKHVKSLSSATKFYLHSSHSDLDSAEESTFQNHRTSSKFLTTLLSPLSKRKNKKSSKNSKTLPSKLTPDYSNFADEDRDDELPLSPNPSEASNGSHFSDCVFDEERRSSFKDSRSKKKNNPTKNYSLTLPPRITIQNPSPTRTALLSDTSSIGSTDSEPFVEITML